MTGHRIEHEQIQIKPGGCWHRREAIDGGRITACNKPFTQYASRDGGTADLCTDGCWSRSEIKTGEIERIDAERHVDTDPALYFKPEDIAALEADRLKQKADAERLFAADDEPTDPNGEEKC